MAQGTSHRYDNGSFFANCLRLTRTIAWTQPNEQKTAGWVTTDLKAGYQYKGFSVTGGINNILDTQYYSHLSYLRDPFVSGVGYRVPENGRNVYLTMAYKF